jgi:hypothetical protein
MNVPLCTPASLSHSYLECGLQLQLDLAELLSSLAEVDAVTWNNNLSVLVFLVDLIESFLEWSSLASVCFSGFTLLYSLRL